MRSTHALCGDGRVIRQTSVGTYSIYSHRTSNGRTHRFIAPAAKPCSQQSFNAVLARPRLDKKSTCADRTRRKTCFTSSNLPQIWVLFAEENGVESGSSRC
jgi:hypothetical protein